MEILKIEILSSAPLLMHSATTVDPVHQLTRKMKAVSSKRTKTLEDHEELKKLEIEASCYSDDNYKLCLPSDVVEACVIAAAKTRKLGAPLKRAGFLVQEFELPLLGWVERGPVEGPEVFEQGLTVTDVIESRNFWFSKPVVVGGSRVIRTRPRFLNWGFQFHVAFDETLVDPRTILELMVIAGTQIGICDWRPKFGRFDVSRVNDQVFDVDRIEDFAV